MRHDTTKNEERNRHDPRSFRGIDRPPGIGERGTYKYIRAEQGDIGAGRKEAKCLVGRGGRGLRKEAETHGETSERCVREEVEDGDNGARGKRAGETYIRRVAFERTGPFTQNFVLNDALCSHIPLAGKHRSGIQLFPANQVRT